MKWLLSGLVGVGVLGVLVLVPRLSALRHFEMDMVETCAGRYEGRWRLLPESFEEYPGLSEGCRILTIAIDRSIPPEEGEYAPSIWGTVTVDGHTRTFHSLYSTLVYNDGDSFVIDPCGQNCPLSVIVYRRTYVALPEVLERLAPLGPRDDQLLITGYLGGQHGTLRYERDL